MDFLELTDEERKGLGELADEGFIFDWTVRSSDVSKTVSLVDHGEILGLVEYERRPADLLNFLWLIEVAQAFRGTEAAGRLLAYVGQDSLEAGFDGFVLFESKSYLYRYYIQTFRAKPVRGRFLMFDTETTLWLVNRYLGGLQNGIEP
jgi:hypothetical protein